MATTNKKFSKTYTTTYKIKFFTENAREIRQTQEKYNELVEKYYNLLFKYEELNNLNKMECLREVEKLTTIGRKKGKPKDYKPAEYIEDKAPGLFKRSAINQAIYMVRSYYALLKKSEEDENFKQPQKAQKFDCLVRYYKGMYRDLKPNGEVSIKLFDGEKWNWYKGKFEHWNFKKDCIVQSPVLEVNKKYVMAYVPVVKNREDIPIFSEISKEKDLKICSVVFTNRNKPITAVIVDRDGKFEKSIWLSYGGKYKNQIQKIQNKKRKNLEENPNIKLQYKVHKTYNLKTNRTVKYYAHVASKQLINFCQENNAKIIVTPAVNPKEFSQYITKNDRSKPIYLRNAIVEDLKYKTYRTGINFTEVRGGAVARKCYKCGEKVINATGSQEKKIKTQCKNGHKLDYYLNSAMNLALTYLKQIDKTKK